MYCKMELIKLQIALTEFNVALCVLAAKNSDVIIPGFTHMQHAQPVRLIDYLMAYSGMLKRDFDRAFTASKNIELTMGSGALAGTPIESNKYNMDISGYINGMKGLGSLSNCSWPRIR